jgi:squalene-hopene/tetraprenyl-beta-curcumene cyclase
MCLDEVIEKTEAHLLGLRSDEGVWRGHLSGSALATATAVVALRGVDGVGNAEWIAAGVRWLVKNQHADGGWGDTTVSGSNLSTTLLCWSALRACGRGDEGDGVEAIVRVEDWVRGRVGSLEPAVLQRAVVARYGKDKTFSVPILMLCAICGTLGEESEAWKRVLPLPFELAALPRSWFGAIGLPVVSYALPALIAIGHARFRLAPPGWWNPLGWVRRRVWPRIRPMLKVLQPSSGGYLEATPLTSFVTMALAAAGEREHPCVAGAVGFLRRSMRADGSWPIDTDLATWGTTLAVKSGVGLDGESKRRIGEWLLRQQYDEVHPFTGAAPGGWAWTELPGGVPDADDTPGVLMALHLLEWDDERVPGAVAAGMRWLLDLQNRDGGMPTFCRGWGTLPFDRSTPELTAHALAGWWLWQGRLADAGLSERVRVATGRALAYLKGARREDGSWVPLWFGNERASGEENPVYGTAQVVNYLCAESELARQAEGLLKDAGVYLIRAQGEDGSWGGEVGVGGTIEETAVSLQALVALGRVGCLPEAGVALERGQAWLLGATEGGTRFPAAPIGLYFARLWYHEQLYPVVWALGALKVLRGGSRPSDSG